MRGAGVLDRRLADDPVRPDPEALIREARRRARRRRMRWAALSAVSALGLSAGLVAAGVRTPGSARLTPSSPVTVDVRAFRGHGVLAFVSKRSLYVLDGRLGRLVRLADPGHSASNPTLSPDGSWIAYLEQAGLPGPDAVASPRGGAGQQLWLARADGADAHRVTSLSNAEMVGWNPSRNLLAVIRRPPQDWTCRSRPTATSVALVTPPEAVRTVFSQRETCPNPRDVYGAAWSPDGRSIAVATTAFMRAGSSRVVAIELAGGTRQTWFSIRNSQRLPGICSGCSGNDVIPDLAGWWAGRGIGFWAFSSGMTRDSDGSPLEVVRAPGAEPTRLGVTLSSGIGTSVTASRSGELAIVRAPWRDVGSGGTAVQVCRPGGRCSAVPDASVWDRPVRFSCQAHHPYMYCYPPLKPGAPDTGVTLDPAWSPNGSLLAYVRGPAVPQSSTSTAEWLDDHELCLYSPTSGKAWAVAGTQGASAPQWSADGRSILYVSHDSLWLLSVRSGRSVRIAGPLFGGRSFASAYNQNNYYHQVPFMAQFGWWS